MTAGRNVSKWHSHLIIVTFFHKCYIALACHAEEIINILEDTQWSLPLWMNVFKNESRFVCIVQARKHEHILAAVFMLFC